MQSPEHWRKPGESAPRRSPSRSPSRLATPDIDFALLTEQQGEALDQIEYQVRAAGEYVESGNADIRYAIKYQTELRRRYCCCCVIVLVVLAVVLIYLAVTNPRLFKKIK